ncbi:protein kinase [Streptomyces sp. NPDC047081]|uniref:serine/threonine-protein kinase n=1 Tax=Streptomyces sp. NPDC047081 TaxID=3154706 RepID=UPI0033DA53E5
MAGETPEQGEGRVINGRYRLLRTLGAGGMGRVWLAHDEELACEVALKEIALPEMPTDAAEPAQRIARARSEARHAARLRGHPHVATVHDVVVHEELPWIVMEYVPDAVDLQAVVRRSGPLPPAQVARIGLAVLDALTAGHRIGILHRDVKPANILLASDASGDPYARVLLTDYGIALQPESREPRLTATAGILGTPGYLAPERARGEPPTPAADLFSLGATLYAAVEGRGPFDRHGDYATLTALLGEEPTPPLRAGALAPALQGLLVKDPVRRSSPEAVTRGLERVVQGAAAGGTGFGTPGGGFGAQQGWGAGASAAGAGAAGAAAAGYGASPGGFGPPGDAFGARTPEGQGGAGGGGAPGRPGTPAGPGAEGVPPGYVGSPPPGYVGGPPPGHGDGPAPGYGESPPPGYVASAPPGGWNGGVGGPGTPQTPGAGAPPTPNTPHTPGGASDTPAGAPGSSAGAPGSPAYDVWRQPAPRDPFAPANPYAQGPATPGGGPGGAQPPPYAGGAATPSPYGTSAPGSGSPAPYGTSAPGSGPPSAYGTGSPGSGSPSPYGTGAQSPNWAAAPTAPGTGGPSFPPPKPSPGPPGPPSGKKQLAIVALVVAAVLVLAGGAWGVYSLTSDDGGGRKNSATTKKSPSASASQKSSTPTGPVLPYGSAVGLSQPLQTGDCVKAVWTGTPFKSAPNLGVVSCSPDKWPDGQVVGIDTATDYADARAQGAKRCDNQSRAIADALPDAGGYAVLPTKEGFAAAKGGTACLVLGRHAAIGGEVGRFRDEGSDLWVGQMSVGDCWVYKEVGDRYKAPLTDCAKLHNYQVIGAVQAPDKMSYKKGIDNANKLCSNKFESTWAPDAERVVYGWVADQHDWDLGFDKAVCTVSRSDGKQTTGKIPAPGSV